MKDLDPLLKALQPGETLELEPGYYRTSGNINQAPNLPVGATLICKDPDGLVRIEAFSTASTGVTAIHGAGQNVVLGLSVYWCRDKAPAFKRNGIFLEPSPHNVVSHCEVSGTQGFRSNGNEGFGIHVNGGKVLDCCVHDTRGDYNSKISGRVLRNCTAPGVPPDPATQRFDVAFNVGDNKDAVIENCSCSWAESAVYMDWHSVDGLEIRDCLFEGVRRALHCNATTQASADFVRTIQRVLLSSTVVILDGALPQVEAILLDHTNADDWKLEVDKGFIRDVVVEAISVQFHPDRPIVTPTDRRFLINAASRIDPAKRSRDLGITNVSVDVDSRAIDPTLLWRNFDNRAEIHDRIAMPAKWTTQ